jgi:2-C-methyl-D-erythritol 2,4-cyclodiphosphate synthase
VHRLVPGRPLVLGGVRIEHETGLDGNSDADVLTHAVIDAILGAAALGTIGEHFPESDQRYQGVASLDLLAATLTKVTAAGRRVVNVDSVVIAEAPRLQGHLATMARNLARTLGIDEHLVAVKATSPEGVGTLGRGEAMAAQAVVLIE